MDSVKGTFLFVDCNVYKKLGGLDESYFIYSEDVDFCCRAKKIGVNNIYFPKTSIIHYGGSSTQSEEVINTIEQYKNILLYLVKRNGKLYSIILKFILIITTFNRIIINVIISVLYEDSVFLRIRLDYIFNHFYGLLLVNIIRKHVKNASKRKNLFYNFY